MVTRIKIIDHVRQCSTYEDGDVIFRLISAGFDNEQRLDNKVELDFDGVLSIPSAFVNAALVQLLDKYSFDYIRSHLNFVGSTRQINDLIKRRFQFALQQNLNK